ncbi:hypothetical protein BCV08_15195 [Vibrio breoganii]|uniref:hypothetical protein n=1 Tax=Vibrio breoganii TaxID=553239 RepID=UPI00031D4783|nr:hypothetical protein [Vibrio breoganii]OEF86037.1 hypothetical protein B003_16150 [Vibrio breoganii 1C10]PMF82707.1 hypothetical protein BCV08_15195 [Vibrio breoganii]
MDKTTLLFERLVKLVERKNIQSGSNFKVLQQEKVKANISIAGGNGRLYVQPSTEGYDVSLSGQSLEHILTSSLVNFFHRPPDGYKQTNANKGFKKQPYWRTDSFKDVETVCAFYLEVKP